MNQRRVEGVGTFYMRGSYWECVPDAVPDIRIECGTPTIHPSQEERARVICSSWDAILEECLQYIEGQRAIAGFESRQFTEPSVIIDVDEWTVFFTTEIELEAVFGVEMRGDEPFQLVIGD
jgi:hypothetical protein